MATETPTPEPQEPSPSGNAMLSPTPTPYPLGDITCNGLVNIDDILLVRDFIFGKTPTQQQMEQLKLLNPSGVANINVILAIRDIIFGL